MFPKHLLLAFDTDLGCWVAKRWNISILSQLNPSVSPLGPLFIALYLEAADGGDSPEDVVVDGVPGGDDVGLHDVHHGRLQLHLPLPARARPRVPVHLLQLRRGRQSVM